jgi:uncharacterized protein (DUF1810 family)
MSDPHNLARFVDAQAPVITRVFEELRSGRKQSHWMWFVFPQIAGLGHSPTARHFAIGSLAEARAFVDHPLLGSRLIEATEIVNALDQGSATVVFGSPDDLKFRSSMTLFAEASPDAAPFRSALDRYFDGRPDQVTLDRLRASP